MRIKTEVKYRIQPRDFMGRFAKAEKSSLQRANSLVNSSMDVLVDKLRDEAPRRTTYGDSFRQETRLLGSIVNAQVFLPQPITNYIVGGTSPHIIRPRGNYALSFFLPSAGKQIYTRLVRHKGTKANPFIGRAVRRWKATRSYGLLKTEPAARFVENL